MHSEAHPFLDYSHDYVLFVDRGRSLPKDCVRKRIFDIVVACIALLLFAPLMAIVFIVVKMDGAPAIFGHKRVGADGKPFTCYKFRSMVTDAHQRLKRLLESNPAAREEWERTHKLTNDPRITRIGVFLRKTSLDELPQLFNVLRGDMSIVGPRPIVEDEIANYRDRFQEYKQCRPGLTGLWQVSGRNLVEYDRRTELDMLYRAHQSLWLDIMIIARTFKALYRYHGY